MMASGFTTAEGKVEGTREAEEAARRAYPREMGEVKDYGGKSRKGTSKGGSVDLRSSKGTSRSSYAK